MRLSSRGLAEALLLWRASLPRWTWRHAPALALRAAKFPPTWAFLGACGVVFFIGFMLYEDASTGLGLMIFSPIFVSMLSLALATGRAALGLGGALPGRMCRAMLWTERCPACGYDLSSMDAHADGCIVCPECAAAWEADRIGPNADLRPKVIVISDWSGPPPSLAGGGGTGGNGAVDPVRDSTRL